MPITGTNKAYKGNGKHGQTLTQFCIDGYLVEEVLGMLPKNIKIFGAKVVVGTGFSKHKTQIPNRLKKFGLQSLRTHIPSYEGDLVFDEVSRKSIKDSIKGVCEALNLKEEKAYFKYITLSNGTANGKFERTTKEIRPDETDMRKKLTVLGLTDAEGKIQGLVADISAKKYHCKIQEVTSRTVICSNLI